MANNIGPKIGIEGEREYRQQLNNIIQQTKTLGSQMNELTSSFDKNMTAEQKSAATSKLLSDQIDTQRNLVSKLADMTARAADKYGENSTEALKWKDALNKAKTELNKLESQADTATEQTEELGDAFDEAGDQTIQFGDVLKANILGDVVMRGLDLLIDKAKEFASGMIDAAAEVRAQASQFEQTFGSLGGVADAKIQSIADETGILDTRMRTAATGIYAFAKASGADSSEALALMEDGLMAAADNAAYYDRSLEDATETLQSFLKGNYANDAALGVSATEATRNAAAYKKFKKEYKDLTEVQKQQTLLQMVLDAQELSGAMGQASREADGWENVQGNLNEAFRQFQAAAGQPFLAQIGPRIQKVTAAMQDLQNRVDWDKIAAAVDGVFGWFDQHGEQVVGVIGAAGAAFATWKIVSSLGSVIPTIQAFGSMIATMATALLSNPFALAAAGLAALVGVIGTHIALTQSETAEMKAQREELENLQEAASNTLQTQKDSADATWDMANASLEEVDRLKDLATKLYELVDPMGNVQEGHETEAEFIMGQLNDALGLEMDLVDGQIKGYDDLATAINGAIAQKKKEVLFQAAEENYTKALKNRNKVEKDYYAAAQRHAEAQEKITDLEKGFWETVEQTDPMASVEDKQKIVDAMKEVSDEYIAVQAELEATEQAEKDLSTAWKLNTQDIQTYESAMMLDLEGKTQEAIRMLESEAKKRQETADAAGDATEDKITAMKREADQAEFYFNKYAENLANGVGGFTEAGLEEARKKMEEAQGKLKDAGYAAGESGMKGIQSGVSDTKTATGNQVYNDGYGLGTQMMNGFNSGVRSVNVTSAVQRQMGNAVTAGRTTLQIHSPSRVFAEIGRYTMEGFEEGILQEAANAERIVSNAFAAMPAMVPEVTLPEVNNQSVTIPNINIYTQEGQDPTSIAREVERVLLHDLRTTEAAFA